MKLPFYDKNLNRMETEDGELTMASLFIPYFIEMVLINLVGTVNTIFLSHSSGAAVAAVGASSQLISMITTFYGVVSSGASIVISQNLGAGNRKKASDAAIISILFSAILSLFIGTVFAIFSRTVLEFMNLTGEILKLSTTYFRIYIAFSFFQAITTALSGILRSYGLPKVAVRVSIVVNIINAAFCYIIIYRPFETPLIGVKGIAIGSVISSTCGMLLMVLLFTRASLKICLSKEILHQLKLVGMILHIGIPGGVTSLSYSLSQVVSTAIIATLGGTALITKVYIGNIVFYVYVLGLSLGMSTSIMIGRLAGARKYDQAYQLNRQNLAITIVCNLSLSLCICLFGGSIMRIFTHNSEIISMAKTILIVDLFLEIGRGFNHIEENSLRGTGDVFFTMIVSVTSCWLASILFSYVLGVMFGLGLFGCWIAFAMDELFRGSFFFFRWKSRKWITKTIV